MVDIVQQFFNYIQYERRLAAHTLTAYQTDLSQFQTYLNHTHQLFDLMEVKMAHIRGWIITMIESKEASTTVNRKISCLKSFYKFCLKSGHVRINPTTKLIRPKIPTRLPKDVRFEKIMDIKDKLELDTASNEFAKFRDYAMFMTFYLCGIRRNELIELTWDKLDYFQQQISVLGKGKKERRIPLKSELIEILKKYQQIQTTDIVNPEDNCIFVLDNGKRMYANFVYRKIQRYLAMVSTQKGIGPHTLRHSFASHLLNEGAELNAIKELLGHSSLAATQIYTNSSIEKLRQVHRISHPKS